MRTTPATGSDVVVRRFGRFSLFAALYTYLLVVFGGIVRITGSGLGCGDDWPKCNGKWIPDFTLETLIEYMHRLLGVTIGLVLIGLAIYAFVHRDRLRGLTGPAYSVLALVVAQGLLGAITVWLELPTGVIVVHFMTALIIMGLLLISAVRAGALGQVHPNGDETARRHARAAVAATVIAFVTITFGALTANTLGAPQACQGFPLCNGSLVPSGASQAHIQWTHRLLAFALLLHVLMIVLRSKGQDPAVRRAAIAALVMVALQIGVAAALVLMHLPTQLQVLHLAVGAAAWGSFVVWVQLARIHASRTTT